MTDSTSIPQENRTPLDTYDRRAHLAWYERQHPGTTEWPREPRTNCEAGEYITQYTGRQAGLDEAGETLTDAERVEDLEEILSVLGPLIGELTERVKDIEENIDFLSVETGRLDERTGESQVLLIKTLAHALRVPPYLSEEGLLLELLGEASLVKFGRNADGSYSAGVDTADGTHRDGRGESPAAALRDAQEDKDLQPYCKTCLEPIGHFIGHGDGWHHYRGEGTPENPTELYDAGHEPAVAWH